MSVPKISKEALQEACGLVATLNESNKNDKEIKEYLLRYNEDFRNKQPELHAFLERTLNFHMSQMQGMALATSIPLFCSIVVNAMYIQSEIDEIGDIFKDL